MYWDHLDFEKISKALEATVEKLQMTGTIDENTLLDLKQAESDLERARSFRLSQSLGE